MATPSSRSSCSQASSREGRSCSSATSTGAPHAAANGPTCGRRSVTMTAPSAAHVTCLRTRAKTPRRATTPAHHGRALVVLQRAGHDLGRRRRAAIDQHNERLAGGQMFVARPCVETLCLLRVAPPGRDDLAALKERIGDRDRLIEQSARIVAQIDDEAAQLVGRDLRSEVAQRLLQAFRRLFVESGDTDVSRIRVYSEGAWVTARIARWSTTRRNKSGRA